MVSRTDSGGGVGGGSGGTTINSRINSSSSQNGNHNNHHVGHAHSTLVRIALHIVAFVYGLLNWFLYAFIALSTGTFFKKSTEKEDNDFAIARDEFWNLSKQPIPGFHHDFFKTRDGFQFHYICNQQQPPSGSDLFVYIHGFPNTCMVWRYLLQESAVRIPNATAVVVDLPGFGGSDSMAKYDTKVLEYLTEFVVAMREKYGTSGDSVGSTFVVAHDWGCVIAMRLAAEAPSIADRFILMNGLLPDLTKANAERALHSSKRIFRQFQMSPRNNFGCLAKSFQAIKPLLVQLGCSAYIFTFQLPSWFVKTLAEGGNLSFLLEAYKREHGQSKAEFNRAESLAANLGPSAAECKSESQNGAKYGGSVLQRVHSVGEIFWHSTSYYRDGLAMKPWEKSIETIAVLYNIDSDLSASSSPARRRSSSATSSLFNDQFKGSLRAPATILWGERDFALTRAMCLDGMADYLSKESEVIVFPDFDHWMQVEKSPRKVLGQIISMFARGNSKQTPSYIADDVKKLHSQASLVAKR